MEDSCWTYIYVHIYVQFSKEEYFINIRLFAMVIFKQSFQKEFYCSLTITDQMTL